MTRVRIRSRSVHTVKSLRYRNTASSWVWSYQNLVDPVEVEWSSMNDSIYRSQPVKPVDHLKVTYIPKDVGYMKDPNHSWYAEEVIPATALGVGLSLDKVAIHGCLNPPSSGVVGSCADDALMEFATQVPQEVDVFNFLLDFKEIGSLIPKIQKNLANTVSGGYLSYQFGWLPMVDDLKKLGSITQTVAARLAWLRRTRGQRVRLGFSKELDFPNSAQIPTLTTFAPSRTFTLNSSRAIFRANGTLYHNLKGLDGVEGTLRGMIAALGLNSPSRVAWERIPFSFLVDYFARTQHIAESLTVQPFAGQWSVSNVTHSFKLLFEADVVWKRSSVWLVPLGTLRGERYIRGVGLPLSSSKLLEVDLSPQQVSIIAALIAGSAK